jgi:hypothetical protein
MNRRDLEIYSSYADQIAQVALSRATLPLSGRGPYHFEDKLLPNSKPASNWLWAYFTFQRGVRLITGPLH